jgi:hypothetical protein
MNAWDVSNKPNFGTVHKIVCNVSEGYKPSNIVSQAAVSKTETCKLLPWFPYLSVDDIIFFFGMSPFHAHAFN